VGLLAREDRDAPLRETYLCGPRDTADARAGRTEIGWAAFRTAVSNSATRSLAPLDSPPE